MYNGGKGEKSVPNIYIPLTTAYMIDVVIFLIVLTFLTN